MLKVKAYLQKRGIAFESINVFEAGRATMVLISEEGDTQIGMILTEREGGAILRGLQDKGIERIRRRFG